MGTSLFNIGVSGLSAAQAGLSTTSHNITNASTPGFTRQRTIQTTSTPQFTGSGFLGQGTDVKTVQRVYSDFLTKQVISAQARQGALSAYSDQVALVDNMLADSSAGLSPALQDFFTGVQGLATNPGTNPASTPSRQELLSSANTLIERFRSMSQQLSDIQDNVNTQLTNTIDYINAYGQQLAQVNQSITVAQVAGPSQPANDLLDQRDELVSNLSKLAGVTTVTDTGGILSVFVGNGVPLVLGNQTVAMSASPSGFAPDQLVFSIKTPNNDSVALPTSQLTSGTLGGLLSFVNDTLVKTQNDLGRQALTLAQTFNSQHMQGQDLNGATGSAFFNFGSLSNLPSSVPVTPNNANSLASSAAVSAAIVSSDYRITYDSASTSYTVARVPANAALAAIPAIPLGTSQATIDGVTLTFGSGSPADNDTFLARPANASGQRVFAESDNAGAAVLDSSGPAIQDLQASDYQVTFDGSFFNVTRLSDNTEFATIPKPATSTQQTLDGVTFTFGSTVQAGDSYLVQPTRFAARDIAVAITSTNQIAAASPIRTSSLTSNQGKASASASTITDSQAWGALPANVKFTVSFVTATTYQIYDGSNTAMLAAPANYTSGQAISLANLASGGTFNAGASITITGTPGIGDQFVVQRNTSGGSDNRNALALGQLQTNNILDGGKTTYQSSYAQLVGTIGNTTRDKQVNVIAQDSVVSQLQATQQSVSGVNLDEEAANLLRYQQAYQAAGKVIEIAGKLFDQILNM